MAQNITLLGASYSAVPAVLLPKTGGGTARFTDVTPTTAGDSDVASGKVYFKADGSQSTGTASGGGSVNVATKTLNVSSVASSISFTQLSGAPKAFFVRCTTTLTRNSSYREYYVADMRWDGSATGGVAGNRWYRYNGQDSNITSGYSYSYSNGTLTLSSTGSQSASPGAFYAGTYELVYVY